MFLANLVRRSAGGGSALLEYSKNISTSSFGTQKDFETPERVHEPMQDVRKQPTTFFVAWVGNGFGSSEQMSHLP